MSRPILVHYVPQTETTVKLSLQCDRCRQHICFVEPEEAAQMAAQFPRYVGIMCHKCEDELGWTEKLVVECMADKDLQAWAETYAAAH